MALNNNARKGLAASLCLNANSLISLIPSNGLKCQIFSQLWYYGVNRSHFLCLRADGSPYFNGTKANK